MMETSEHKTTAGSGKGTLFVLSAPSGAGKTTLCRRLMEILPSLSYSVSHTTRPPREGEIDGVDYHFVSVEVFKTKISQNDWAEWAKVHDNYYGTSLSTLQAAIKAGKRILLDIDVQGARQIKEAFPDAVLIFIMAPSMAILEKRLRHRGTDSEAVIRTRLRNAVEEINQNHFFDYIIVNDSLEEAVNKMVSVILEATQ